MRRHLVLPLLLAATVVMAEDRPFLGLGLRPLTEDEKKTLSLERGGVVDRVSAGAAAEKAGLQKGDVVLRIGDEDVPLTADIRKVVGALAIGKETQVVFLRDGKEQTAAIAPVSYDKWRSMEGLPAPRIEFRDFAGDRFSWDDLKGRVTVLAFFQVECPGSAEVHPRIEEFAKEFGPKGAKVVGVHTAFEDFDGQTDEKVKAYVKEKAFSYPVGIAKSDEKKAPAVMDDYRTGGTPCLCVVDAKGIIRFKVFGDFDAAEVKTLLAKLLEEK